MIKDIILTLKLRYTYKINAIIHSFRTIPVVGKHISYITYGLYDAKRVLRIALFIIYLIGYPFLFFLMSIFIYFISSGYLIDNPIVFSTIFLICSVLLNIFRPNVFRADRDSDYAINSLHMDAKRYLLNNYIFKIIMEGFGFIVGMYFAYLIGLKAFSNTIPTMLIFTLPILYIAIRNTTACVNLIFAKKNIIITIYYFILVVITALIGYATFELPALAVVAFKIYYYIFIAIGLISLIGLLLYKNYHFAFKYFYSKKIAKKSLKEMDMERISNTIDNSANITSDKHGYDLLHDLFVKRHSKILLKPIIGYSIAEIVIVLIAIIAVFVSKDFRNMSYQLFEKYSLYFLVIMYFINRGEKITKAMFMNCDHAMLTYRVYRNPKVILEMFKRRLKTSIKLNLVPALILSVGCLILLIFSGFSITNIILFPLSLIFISIFFSVHNLVLYYLLQPYNSGTEERSKSYRIARMVTYFIFVYPALYFEFTISPEIFSLLCLGISVVYVIVSLMIINKYASKTFKIYY